MKPNLLIPLTATAVMGCTPAFVGDFELTRFAIVYDAGESYQLPGASGPLAIDKDLGAELTIAWSDDGESYAFAFEGDADAAEDDGFSLDLSGTFTNSDGSYATSLDLVCGLDDDGDAACTGDLALDGDSYSVALDFAGT
jgi:hypothetical protein